MLDEQCARIADDAKIRTTRLGAPCDAGGGIVGLRFHRLGVSPEIDPEDSEYVIEKRRLSAKDVCPQLGEEVLEGQAPFRRPELETRKKIPRLCPELMRPPTVDGTPCLLVKYNARMSIQPGLREQLFNLPAEERQELADELYESLGEDASDPEWEREWSEEIDRRLHEVATGAAELVDADDVHASLREELRGRQR